LANFFVLSIFGKFYHALETRLLKSENRFNAQHLPPRAVEKLNDDHVATIYEAYQADIYLSLEDFRREVARWQTHWVITKRSDLPTTLKSSSLSFYRYNIMGFVNHASSKCYC
jgi:hypothetical protein